MSEKLTYPAAIENTAHSEYLASETELETLQKRLDAIIAERGEGAVPQALLIEMTNLYTTTGSKLKDWLESLNLD